MAVLPHRRLADHGIFHCLGKLEGITRLVALLLLLVYELSRVSIGQIGGIAGGYCIGCGDGQVIPELDRTITQEGIRKRRDGIEYRFGDNIAGIIMETSNQDLITP